LIKEVDVVRVYALLVEEVGHEILEGVDHEGKDAVVWPPIGLFNLSLLALLEQAEVSSSAHCYSSLPFHQDALGRYLHGLRALPLSGDHPQIAA
jgi:hypothetical protein